MIVLIVYGEIMLGPSLQGIPIQYKIICAGGNGSKRNFIGD